MLLYVKSAGAAFATFVGLAASLGTFWAVLLGPVMEGTWDRLSDTAAERLGGGLLAFAILSGLAIYFVVLARLVRALGAPRVRRHLLTSGLLPPLLALAGIYGLVANMRLGW